jgi:hypothetical protein
MSGQPWAAEWEHIVGRDLVPHLIPDGQTRDPYRPADTARLPAGAHADLRSAVGRVEPEDLLVIPAAAWQWDRRRQSLYCPPCVAAIGEQAAGLWVRDVPAPGVRIQVPLTEIAAIECHAGGSWRALAVTGQTGRLALRYHRDAQAVVDAWCRRLRLRAAPAPEPIPLPGPRRGPGNRDLDEFSLYPGEDIVSASWRSPARLTAFLLAVTSREVIIVRSRPLPGQPWRRFTLILYVPRQAVEDAEARAGTVRLRSAGTEVSVRLGIPKTAAAAASWLDMALGSQERSGADWRWEALELSGMLGSRHGQAPARRRTSAQDRGSGAGRLAGLPCPGAHDPNQRDRGQLAGHAERDKSGCRDAG